MDILGKIIAGILVVFMIFIHPLQYLFEANQSVISSYVESKGTEFVDHTCHEGEFTVKQYEQLQAELSDTGELYEIELEHTHPVIGAEKMAMQPEENMNCVATSVSDQGTLIQTAAGHVHTENCYYDSPGTSQCGYYITTSLYDISGDYTYKDLNVIYAPGYRSDKTYLKDGFEDSALLSSQRYKCPVCGNYTFLVYTKMDKTQYSTAYIIETTDDELHYTMDSSTYTNYGTYKYDGTYGAYIDLNKYVIELKRELIAAGYKVHNLKDTGYADYALWLNLGDWEGNLKDIVTKRMYLKPYGYSVHDHPENNTSTWAGNYQTVCKHLTFSEGTLVCDKIIKSIVPVSATQIVKQGEPIDQRAVVTYLNGDTQIVIADTDFNTNTIRDGQYARFTYPGYKNANNVRDNVVSLFQFKIRVDVKTPKVLDSIQANISSDHIHRLEDFPIQSVTLYFSNNQTETVTTGWSYTGFDNTRGGSQTVTVSYTWGGLTRSTNVNIYVKVLSYIVADMTREYIYKYESFPMKGLTLVFNDGSTDYVESGWSLVNFVNNKKGTYTVTVQYSWWGTTCYTYVNLTVFNFYNQCPVCGSWYQYNDDDYDEGCPYCNTHIDHIYLSQYELSLNYGQSMDITVYAVFLDGHEVKVTGWYSDYDPTNIGDQIVTVSYGTYKDKLIVRIKAKRTCPVCGKQYEVNKDGSDPGCPYCSKTVVSITASPSVCKVYYGNSLPVTVTATYKDGHSASVTGWTSNLNSCQMGIQNVTVSYKGKSAKVKAEVIKITNMVTCSICGTEYDALEHPSDCPYCSKKISYITASLISGGTQVQLGSELSLRIIITYYDSHRSMAYSGYTVENYDKARLGTQRVDVYYKGFHCFLDIEVVNTLLKKVCPNGHVYSLNDDGSDPGCPYCLDTAKSNVVSYLKVTYTADILKALYGSGSYQIPEGDYFTIIITRNKRKSDGLNSIAGSEFLEEEIRFTYGGKVS